jgi:hypothetical protein
MYFFIGHGIAARLDRARQQCEPLRGPTVKRSPIENAELPIYDDLVRERGDVVAEAQLAARHTQDQAVELLGAQHDTTHPDAQAGPAAGDPHVSL